MWLMQRQHSRRKCAGRAGKLEVHITPRGALAVDELRKRLPAVFTALSLTAVAFEARHYPRVLAVCSPPLTLAVFACSTSVPGCLCLQLWPNALRPAAHLRLLALAPPPLHQLGVLTSFPELEYTRRSMLAFEQTTLFFCLVKSLFSFTTGSEHESVWDADLGMCARRPAVACQALAS